MPPGADMGILRRRDGSTCSNLRIEARVARPDRSSSEHAGPPFDYWTGLASVSRSSVECVCLFEQPHGLRRIVATLF